MVKILICTELVPSQCYSVFYFVLRLPYIHIAIINSTSERLMAWRARMATIIGIKDLWNDGQWRRCTEQPIFEIYSTWFTHCFRFTTKIEHRVRAHSDGVYECVYGTPMTHRMYGIIIEKYFQFGPQSIAKAIN